MVRTGLLVWKPPMGVVTGRAGAGAPAPSGTWRAGAYVGLVVGDQHLDGLSHLLPRDRIGRLLYRGRQARHPDLDHHAVARKNLVQERRI